MFIRGLRRLQISHLSISPLSRSKRTRLIHHLDRSIVMKPYAWTPCSWLSRFRDIFFATRLARVLVVRVLRPRCAVGASLQLLVLWSHIPNMTIVRYTSSIPQHDVVDLFRPAC